MPAAVEDMERPVIPSFASSTGSQHGPSKGGFNVPGAGKNASPSAGGRVPFSSGRSVPHTSGHLSSRRGTPARPLRGSAGTGSEPALAAPEDYLTGGNSTAGFGARGFTGGIEEGETEVSVSDGTEAGSGASAAAESSTTPSAYVAGEGTTFHRKDSSAE